MRYSFSSGQRVLDGYVIKRGIGRGGFGEVFYAVSDGGKEVALKLVRGDNLDVELRGIAQCLNLKHPNLLALFDLRTDAQGDHWVVMEYISGESLANVLQRHPQGLPIDLARQWFLEMARGVAYLHDHGIVHRDLKPGNIFLEGGAVKVGDYGLCKFISSSQHAAQTQSVGTVHYMAPEVSTGNYNKQVDVYAAGIILFEMITGKVPFDGESTGEILMKHLTSPPDLRSLPAEYVPIVGKALAKNPSHRFATMTEMARAVEEAGEEQPVRAARPSPNGAAAPAPGAGLPNPPPGVAPPARGGVSLRGQLGELCGSMALTALFAAVAYTICASVGSIDQVNDVIWDFFLTVASCWAVLVPAKVWNGHPGDSGIRRAVMLVLGAAVGLGAFWLDGGTLPWRPAHGLWGPVGGAGTSPLPVFVTRSGLAPLAGYLSYFGLAFFAVRWWKLADRNRSHRFSVAPVLAVAFWAIVLLVVWPWPKAWQLGVLPLILTSAIVQLVSPWEAPPPPAAKRMRLRYA
jgi:hypothetical protein